LEKLEIHADIYLSDAERSLHQQEMTLMPISPSIGAPASQKPATAGVVLLTPKETAARLHVSNSWLAKARMRGDGPPFIKVGRSIRYSEAALLQWLRSQQRLSTSELPRSLQPFPGS
jgi:hypothetical protein